MKNTIGSMTEDDLREAHLQLGSAIWTLPRISYMLGHTTPASTIRGNYIVDSENDSTAARFAKTFIRDLFLLSTQEICDKWDHDKWPIDKFIISENRIKHVSVGASLNLGGTIVNLAECVHCRCITINPNIGHCVCGENLERVGIVANSGTRIPGSLSDVKK